MHEYSFKFELELEVKKNNQKVTEVCVKFLGVIDQIIYFLEAIKINLLRSSNRTKHSHTWRSVVEWEQRRFNVVAVLFFSDESQQRSDWLPFFLFVLLFEIFWKQNRKVTSSIDLILTRDITNNNKLDLGGGVVAH